MKPLYPWSFTGCYFAVLHARRVSRNAIQKRALALCILACTCTCLHAQNSPTWPSTGPVGIGTASPQYPLDVRGNIYTDHSVIIDGGDLILQRTSNAYGFVTRPPIPGFQNLAFSVTGGSPLENICLNTNTAWITGNVGINTSAPQGKLHIVENNNTASVILESNSAGWGSGIYFKNTAPNGKGYGIYTSSYGSLNIADVNAGVDRIFIGANGNVGVNTNKVSDANYRFFVEGAIRARKVKVDQDSWPDYVFDKNYTLLPLAEVERFIKKYQHLPEVPAAGDVKKEGIDLGNNQAVLLKKIEELTLYLIEQQKQMDALRQQVKELQIMIVKNKNK